MIKPKFILRKWFCTATFLAVACLLLFTHGCGTSDPLSEAHWERPDLLEMEIMDGMAERHIPAPLDEETEGLITREDFSTGSFLTSQGVHTVSRSLLEYSDGRILSGGRVDSGTLAIAQNNFSLARYHPDGSLDTSFNSGGKVSTDFGQGRGEIAHAIATDSNGKIIAVGRYNFGTAPSNYFVFAVARYNSNGSLDTSFGSTGAGTLITNINSLNAVARGVAIQNDNKIVVAGYNARVLQTFWNGTGGANPHINYDMAVVRYNVNGSLDTSFANTGILTLSFNSGTINEGLYGVTIESNTGKIVAAGMDRVGSDANFAFIRLNTNGILDTSFDGDGKRTIYINSGSAVVNAITIQTDNKILAGGYAWNGTSYDMAIARLTTTGALDTTFNSKGWTVTDVLTSREDMARAITVQDDGKIVLVGRTMNSQGNDDVAMVRYNTNGSLDTSTFGTNGRVTRSTGTGDEIAFAALAIPGGIIVSGRTMVGSNNSLLITRYNKDGSIAPSGSLDKSFGSSGKAIVSVTAADDTGMDIVEQSDGKLIAIGKASDTNNVGFLLVRFKTDGTLDTSFVTSGIRISSLHADGSEGLSLALMTDGRIYSVGRTMALRHSMIVARYTTSGTLDTTFGTNAQGFMLTSFSTGTAIANGVVIGTNSRPTIAGRAYNGTNYDFGLVRYLTNGALDTAFASTGTGRTTTSILTRDDIGMSAAMFTDGKIYVAGHSYNATNDDFAIARYATDGRLDSTFTTTGKVTTSIGTNEDHGVHVAIQADGKPIVGGYFNNGTAHHLAMVRYTVNGTLDTTFGVSGRLTDSENASANYEVFNHVLLPSNRKIVGVGTTYNGSNNEVLVARYSSAGALDTTFGSTGRIVYSIGTSDDGGYFGIVDSVGRIIAGGYTLTGAKKNLLVIRLWP